MLAIDDKPITVFLCYFGDEGDEKADSQTSSTYIQHIYLVQFENPSRFTDNIASGRKISYLFFTNLIF